MRLTSAVKAMTKYETIQTNSLIYAKAINETWQTTDIELLALN